MDNETNDKLNDTLGKMGVMAPEHSANSSKNTPPTSDKSFYLIMLALIVGMFFYVSYDMEQRYGSNTGTASDAGDDQPAGATETLTPVIVGIEKVETVSVKPVAEIQATATTPEAVVVEKIVQKTTVTTEVVPVDEVKAALEMAKLPAVTETKTEAVTEPAVAAPQATQEAMENVMDKMGQTMSQVAESMADAAAPVVAPPALAESAPTSAPENQPEQYNPYGRPYRDNYYPPQRPYGNYYNNQNRNNPYRNPYQNDPYGYNPYQRPASPYAE